MPTRKSIVPKPKPPADTVDMRTPDQWAGKLRSLGGSRNDRFNHVLANAAARTLWHHRDEAAEARADKLTAATVALRGLEPQDEVEGMLAAQIVGLHAATMECLRRAMIPEQPGEVASKLRRDAVSCARAMAEMCAALDRRRGKGHQTVRVEHVTVQSGGQAIVGAVAPAAPPRGVGGDARSWGQPHAPRAAAQRQPCWRSRQRRSVRRQDARRRRVPGACDAERAVPDARGHQHRAADGRGLGADARG